MPKILVTLAIILSLSTPALAAESANGNEAAPVDAGKLDAPAKEETTGKAAPAFADKDVTVEQLVSELSAANAGGDPAKIEAALAKLEKAAGEGSAEATFRLGRYHHIESRKPDFAKALSYYEKAAAAGNAWAVNNIGLLSENQKDFAKAREYYEKAAALNEAHSFGNLARFYLAGIGVTRDVAKGVEWLDKGIAAKSKFTASDAGNIFYYGQYGIPIDYKKALAYFEKGGEFGDDASLWRAARMYMEGDGFPPDFEKGLKILHTLDERDYSAASNTIGSLYSDGKGGLTVDKVKAIKYWERSASLGYCFAMMNLGFAYEHGWGTAEDQTKAADYFESAVKCGNPPEGFDMWKLGTRYSKGVGRPRDCKTAGQLFYYAMELGYYKAGVDLGYMYENGCGEEVKPDLRKAFNMYLVTAKLGVPLAQNNVGAMLKHGRGIEGGQPDKVSAFAWLTLAKEGGSGIAAENLKEFDRLFDDKQKGLGSLHLQLIKTYIVGPGDDMNKASDGRY